MPSMSGEAALPAALPDAFPIRNCCAFATPTSCTVVLLVLERDRAVRTPYAWTRGACLLPLGVDHAATEPTPFRESPGQ